MPHWLPSACLDPSLAALHMPQCLTVIGCPAQTLARVVEGWKVREAEKQQLIGQLRNDNEATRDDQRLQHQVVLLLATRRVMISLVNNTNNDNMSYAAYNKLNACNSNA